MKLAFFGSSLLSAYWNGAATYYRGLIRALHERGHQITFYEPDAFQRQEHRDIEPPAWCESVVYPNTETDALRCVDLARGADVIVKASGVGVFDELLEAAVLERRSPKSLVAFLDVDAPATLERVAANPADPFRPLVPQYDVILTYGGGPKVVEGYRQLGAKDCVGIYNALDPGTHHPAPRDERFSADLAFLGNRLPDRELRVEEFFLRAAGLSPQTRFLLGGNGWESKALPGNVRHVGHVFTADHNTFNCTPRAVLNIARESMARFGFSPATRVFEAAGAGACVISDDWEGLETFFEPEREMLVAKDGEEVAALLEQLTPERSAAIGQAALRRAVADHTYARRAQQLENVLDGSAP